jgi:hypothetical protein
MLYIHHTACISPQQTLSGPPAGPVDGVYNAIEPAYEGLPANILRRMSKSVRLGVGAALPLIRQHGIPDGILTGTGNGGMEESIKFLRQLIEYDEGLLAPGHFVQSIPNAIASQIGLLTNNRGYNSTYVHKGLGFEHALLDAAMLLQEHPGKTYLVGGVDELSRYNYQIELANGWYKTETQPGKSLYDYHSPGSIAGEGAAVFLVNAKPGHALAAIRGVATLHSNDDHLVRERVHRFLRHHLPRGEKIDLLLTGENGDNRAQSWYRGCEAFFDEDTTVARFKHLCGEYPTASAFAIWLACQLRQDQPLPDHLVKHPSVNTRYKYIFLYNNYQLSQHSFILLERSPSV